MRQRAAEMYSAPPDGVAWFRYGATYVVSLLAMVDFYTRADRPDEAMDVAEDLVGKLAGADSVDTIVRNMLRLGVFWDESEQAKATGRGTDLNTKSLLDIVRYLKEGGH